MESAKLPSLRVEPASQHDGESVLRSRQVQQTFLERGLSARDEARMIDDYVGADDVLSELGLMLATHFKQEENNS